MQSGRRMQGRAARQKNKHQNSFAPSDNSFNNEFASIQSGVQHDLQSQMLPNNSKNYEQSSRFDQDNRSQQQKPSKNSKNEKNYARKEQRIQAIREENIEIRKQSPLNNKKKNPSSMAPSQPSKKGEEYYKEPQKRVEIISQNDEYQQPEVQQERKIQNVNLGMEKLSQSLVDLREKYQQFQKQQSKHKLQKDDTSKIHINSPKNYQKHLMFGQKSSEEIEKQFAQYRKRQNKQKQNRRKFLEQIAKKQKARIQQEKKNQQRRRSQQKLQKLNEIKALHNFQQKHKKLKEQQAQQKRIIEQYRKKFEKKGPLSFVKKFEEKDREQEKKRIEEQKLFLAERRQMFKPIDFDKINQHQKWYYEKLQQIQSDKREQKQAKLKQIDEKNAQFPQFYRGSAHSVALQERLQKIRRKKQPQQKVKRIKEYKQYVREHFVPRTYENKSLKNSKIKDEASRTHRQIKRYRYYKGISYGEMVQHRPIAKSLDEIKRLGNGNFQYMKKIPKKRSNSPQMQAYELKLMQNMSYGQRLKREDHYLSEQKMVKDTKIVLHEKVEVQELKMIMKRLKANDEKLKHKQHALNSQPQIFNSYTEQKQINQQFVDNLERKLSLLSQL